MEVSEYKNIYKNESSHFYYVANHDFFLSRVRDLRTKNRRLLKILDAGCGTGLLAKKLGEFGDVVGVDIDKQAVFYSKKRGVKVKKASVNRLPFASKIFDIVTCMDVLYHKRVNDKKALSEMYRVLKPGGIFLLRVPANPILFSTHDRFVHGRQRYTKSELLKKLTQAGFKVRKITYVNSVLFFPTLAKVIFEKIKKSHDARSGIKPVPNFINQTIIFLLGIENLLIKRVILPFGIGLFAVAKKQKNP